MRAIHTIILFFGCISLFTLTCNVDHGLRPIHSKIGGTIQFTGDRVPLNTDEIRVAVVKDFPPRNIKELLFSDMLPFREGDTTVIKRPVSWEIFVPPGEYDMAAVIWKENNEAWNISDVVGIYGGVFLGDMLIPSYRSIWVPSYDSAVDTLTIQANLNRVNRDAKISGSITFQGNWPANTGIVGIGAFVDIPKKGDLIDYYLKNVALAYGIPAYVSEYQYQLRVRSKDVINYVSVIWIDSSYDLTSLRDVGFYADPLNPGQPGQVTVSHGGVKQDVNITVDFSKF